MAEEAGFDVPLTKDKNMCYQLNLEGRKIAVIALSNGLWPFVKKDNTTTDSCPKTVLSAVVFPPSFRLLLFHTVRSIFPFRPRRGSKRVVLAKPPY